ncbi:ABC transporter permease [soil metagenome]
MNNSLFHLISIHIKEFKREPEIIFWSLIFPIAIAGVLGLAFMSQEEPVRKVALINVNDQSLIFDSMPPQVEHSGPSDTKFAFIESTFDEAFLRLKRGEVNLIVERANDELLFHFDPDNSEGHLTFLLLENKLLQQKSNPSSYKIIPITTRGNRYIDFLIPGLIALGIMNSCVWGIGWNLIELRIKKLMRRMVATPMKKSTFLYSHIITRTILVLLEALIVFAFAYFAFDVNIQGSILALLIVVVAGIVAFSGIAILMSSRAQKTQVGNGLINAVVLPMTILSGIFFSYQNFLSGPFPL